MKVKDNFGNFIDIASVTGDWTTPAHNVEREEPQLSSVGNPGNWDLFVF